MIASQRIVRVRRTYNQWVANQTLEDYALRFTAKTARKWSSLRVANTAIGAISFLALEAIGGTVTMSYGFTNATAAIVAVGILILATSVPIAYYAATYGVDIDLLTRGAGFGYIGSTITSLIYASFTFLFFAIEAAIMSLALEMCFGVPLFAGYIVSSLVVIPLVTHGITFISRFQLWTQPLWIVLHLLPFGFIAYSDLASVHDWTRFPGVVGLGGHSFSLLLFGAASTVVFSLIAQIGEQVDFLRFLPPREERGKFAWWSAYLSAGPGWIVLGVLKLLAGSFLAVLALRHGIAPGHAAEPTQMYLVAFGYVFSSPKLALAFTGAFVIVSQIKINVTNAYAGSIAWSNFFSRLTHSHPGRVVWLVFNVTIALVLMELGIFRALERILGLYSIVAVAWVGALVADLVINKPLKLSPPYIEFKRAYLYDLNPVGVGAMLLATVCGIASFSGLFGATLQALASFVALGVAFFAAPAIAYATKGKYYLARAAQQPWAGHHTIQCCVCEHYFEHEDMAQCPAYMGPICSLCCSLEARCHDCCKPQARFSRQIIGLLDRTLPAWVVKPLNSEIGHYAGVLSVFSVVIGAVLLLVYYQVSFDNHGEREAIRATLWTVFFILTMVVGVVAWLFVLAQESRRVAEEESLRQTELLMQEIDAHKRTDAKLQRAKEVAEAASEAKSRYVVGLSHELRTPLNAILGYAQILERDKSIPPRRVDAVKVVRKNAEHLSGLIDGLLDISKIEAGRFKLNRDEVRIHELMAQVADMFQLQAAAKGIDFRFSVANRVPDSVHTDESRLRQILINLLSNAIKFTDAGHVALRMDYRNQVATFEVEDTGVGIAAADMERIFRPFERALSAANAGRAGTGLGLTITKLLTETLGGEVRVTSAPGKGSTFRVKLLLAEVASPRPALPMERQIEGYTGPRQTVVVVDDDPAHRGLMRDLLGSLGFLVVDVANGDECLAYVEMHKVHLVLLDVAMPGLDGWEVARRIRRSERERPAIIMVTANALDKSRENAAERSYDDYLMKPTDIRQLLQKINTLLAIEWIHDGVASTPSREGPMPTDLGVPPSTTIDELIHLGEIGHLRGIQVKLAAIEDGEPEHRAFVSEIRATLAGLNLKQYVSVLKALRGLHAE